MAEFIRVVESPPERTEVYRSKNKIRHIFSSESVDRHHSVIDPVGVDTEGFFRMGAPVPWEHGQDGSRGMLPVAFGVEAGLDKFKGRSVLVGLTEFPDIDEFSYKIWLLYADRRLRGWSVKFVPDYEKVSAPTREEVRARPELAKLADAYRDSDGKRGYVVRKCDLVHYSTTADPSNTDSTTIEVLRSIGAMGSLPGLRRSIDAQADQRFNRGREKLMKDLIADINMMRLQCEQKRLEGMFASQAERERARIEYTVGRK